MAISAEDRAAIAQAMASKLAADLGSPASGLAKLQAASEQRIIKAVTAGLDAKAIAAAIPADMAKQVADILAQRLSA